jgi:hypothetical protein
MFFVNLICNPLCHVVILLTRHHHHQIRLKEVLHMDNDVIRENKESIGSARR